MFSSDGSRIGVIFWLGTVVSLGQAGGVLGAPPETMSGDFSGRVVTVFLDRALVQSWLPAGLRRAEDCPFERHPVLILYGTQRNLARTKRVTRFLPYGRCYRETFVAVPYLRVDAGRSENVFYFARVYLDSLRATEMGIKRFGWAKTYTRLSHRGLGYRIWNPSGRLIFAAASADSAPRPVEPDNGSLKSVREMLSQTLVLKHEGRFDRYDFDIEFDRARVEAVDCSVRIEADFMPGLATMAGDVAGIDVQEFGAFSIDCHFTKRAK